MIGLTDREAVCLRQPRHLESVEISHRALVISPGPFPAVVGGHGHTRGSERQRRFGRGGTSTSSSERKDVVNQAWSLQLGLTRVALCEPVLFRAEPGND